MLLVKAGEMSVGCLGDQETCLARDCTTCASCAILNFCGHLAPIAVK